MTASHPDFTGLFIQTILILVFVIGLALVFLKYVLPRMGRFAKRSGANFQVLDRLMLEPHKSVYLLRAGKRYWVVGASQSSLNYLGELNADEVAHEDK